MSVSALSYVQHARAMLVLGVPLVGSQLAHAIIGLTDTVMLGWHSIEALAAGVLGTSFFFTLFVVGSGGEGVAHPAQPRPPWGAWAQSQDTRSPGAPRTFPR